ncbi:LLM class flavin-dependent oxidoreductase [Ornithinimicrobium ciconiae]|uniref:LLM class flavin-dependent oxidoreductase n=1 Tax=Ornithinimicrobium ciconiae TaxID=2594265 RepID=A0A516G7I7_9MICO|nr:LLM class flavin-dependent oxidoreductase [Ornithinimicrobium ciconiae]QDO87497.1 LLM class flavin-dependent oxidoreductase [Ornithinimicrobium ciconiae]
MRHGVCILPEYPWAEAQHLWRRAEELGFDHAWTYDHLVWGGLPDAPWHSTVGTLTAAAMVTERIQLGTLVSSPNFRHPVTLARDVVTLDDISGGRMLLGVGAGGDVDAGILGDSLTRGERSRRFREFVPLLQRSLREDHVDHTGEFYSVVNGRNLTPSQAPLLVAADGPKAMALAVEYADGWVTTGPASGDWAERDAVEQWWRGVADAAQRFTDAEASVHESASGHDAKAGAGSAQAAGGRRLDRYLTLDASGPVALSSVSFLTEQVGRAAELGFTDVIVHWPRSEAPYAADLGVLERYLDVAS